MNILLYPIMILIMIFVGMYKDKITVKEEIINTFSKKRNDFIMILLTIGLLIALGFSLFFVTKYYPLFTIITILLFALNIYTAYHIRLNVLTEKGKVEKKKLLELKKYIMDYSLIEKRDLESVIIWDDYLAYATAFGITNKVIDSIYEGWYNLNMDLQVIDKVLEF